MLEWIRFGLGSLFLLCGMLTFLLEMFGVFRFRFVLNRMHAAALGDTLGISLSMIGLMIISGWNFTTLKMALVVIFLWCASPVSSHLIARLEVATDEELEKHCEIVKGLSDKEETKEQEEVKERAGSKPAANKDKQERGAKA